MTSVIFTGDSHLGALKRGSDILDDDQQRQRLVFQPLGTGAEAAKPVHVFDAASGEVRITAASWQKRVFSRNAIAEFGTDAAVIVSLPFQSQRLLRLHAWQKFVPWKFAEAEFALSDQMVQAMAAEACFPALAFVRDVHKIWPRTYVLESPRLFANSVWFRKFRPEVVRHVDRLFRDHARSTLLGMGVGVIDQSTETVDADCGLTAPAFDHENPADDHHANAAFGRIAVTAVLERVDRDLGRVPAR